MNRYEGYNRKAAPGQRTRRVQAASPAQARKVLAETGHVLVPSAATQRRRSGLFQGGGYGAGR